ncbi:MAG TPA: hypothetical protein VHG51_14875, partial [Longimicrobiaceae bacterium]|nr:hypothetical protein [Longimicrobiaceae bacterium]
MDLLYVLSAAGNLLYEGQFGLHGRYQTYGQQSFIYDLLVAASRHSVRVSLAVDDPRVFPLTSPLARYATVHDFSAIRRPGGPPSAAIVDVVSDD